MKKKKEVDIKMLKHWKEQYDGHKIIYVRFLNEEFVFRSLTRKEYKLIIQTIGNRLDIEDAICNMSCIYPEDYDFSVSCFAGLNEYVASIIEKTSGFDEIRSIFNMYYHFKEEDNLETQCMDLIKAFIPEYTYEEMEEWTWEKLMKITVRAEKVAKLKGYDLHLEDKSEEYIKNIEKISSSDSEFIDKLYEKGIDPMFYFKDEIKAKLIHNVLDFPLISSGLWYDEVMLDVIRKQRNR